MTNLKNIPNTVKNKRDKPPIWLMRQAGRYLPEYREVRTRAGDFLDLCYNPKLACEVTLQPIQRFDCDAAIIFSDILLVLHALGQKLWFETGEGPRLGELVWTELNRETLDPVYDAVRLTRSKLQSEKSLIGFAGAPWTLLLYAMQGRGGHDFAGARQAIYTDLKIAQTRIDILTNAVITHLENQIVAGCDTVQLFDSWAGLCPTTLHHDFIINPTQKIVAAIKSRFPDVVFVGFPKGFSDLQHYTKTVKPDVLGIDHFTPLRPDLFPHITLQGNLDPMVLKAGGIELDRAVDGILSVMDGHHHIFNLGHGIDKDTPIAHVEQIIKRIRT